MIRRKLWKYVEMSITHSCIIAVFICIYIYTYIYIYIYINIEYMYPCNEDPQMAGYCDGLSLSLPE